MPAGSPTSAGALLTDAFAGQLQAAIARGAISPGSLLPPERELAERHALARVTVRRALRKLASAGFLKCCPRVGYKVVHGRLDLANSRPVGIVQADVSAMRAPSKSIEFIEAAFARAGRALLIGSSHLKAAEEDACIRRFQGAGAAGLIVTPAVHGTRSTELEAWIRSGMPIVLDGHPGRWLLPDGLSDRCDWFDTDNRGAVREALARLMELGHTRIAYVTSADPAGSERHAAFREFMAERSRPARPEWIRTRTDDSRAGGADSFRALFALRPAIRPTAVLTGGGDEIALGFIAAARAAGLGCPEDVSVISFGDNRLVADAAGLAELSSFEYSCREDAETQVRLLLEQISGMLRPPRHIRVPVTLRERATCAPVPDTPCPQPRRPEAGVRRPLDVAR